MPDHETATDTIMALFKTSMDSLRPNVPIAWPNIDFSPKDDFDESTHEAWARITIGAAGAIQASLGDTGTRRWRTRGLVFVQIFAPLGNGANEALAIADDVATTFRGVTTSGVRIKAPDIEAIGRDEAFFQVNVTTPFEYDQTA